MGQQSMKEKLKWGLKCLKVNRSANFSFSTVHTQKTSRAEHLPEDFHSFVLPDSTGSPVQIRLWGVDWAELPFKGLLLIHSRALWGDPTRDAVWLCSTGFTWGFECEVWVRWWVIDIQPGRCSRPLLPPYVILLLMRRKSISSPSQSYVFVNWWAAIHG